MATAPYIILASVLLLLSQFVPALETASPWFQEFRLEPVVDIVRRFVSLAFSLSLAYHFAQRYQVDQLVAILLTIAVYATVLVWGDQSASLPAPSIAPSHLILPVLSVLLLRFLSVRLSFNLSCDVRGMYVCRIYQYIYSFLVAYVLIALGYWLVVPYLYDMAFQLGHLALPLATESLLLIRVLVIHLLWFLGLHGPHLVNTLTSTDFLMQSVVPGLTYWDLYRLFAINGGSGMGMALMFAIFIGAKDRLSLTTAKFSAPFVLFNINTLIIYALPVVLNRYMLLPFVLTPIINTLAALWLVPMIPVEFQGETVAWTTPIFLNGYLATGGSLALVPLQLVLLALSVAIYLPFVRRYSQTQSSSFHLRRLTGNLGISDEFKAHERISLHQAHRLIIESNIRLSEVIGSLTDKDLMVYYQPKVDIARSQSKSFEALLRLRQPDGKVTGPFFLKDIEIAGLAPVLDLWVCKRVKSHLEFWKERGFTPHVSINLHPDTLQDSKVIEQISTGLAGWPVEFEILERALVESDSAMENLRYLKQQGFRIAIDDFGVGYSSYQFISSFDIDTIKVDKTLIDRIEDPKGYLVCKHAFLLSKDLQCDCIAEGAETARQITLLREIGARYIQGWYFAPALPVEEVMNYQPGKAP